jgi:membrane protease YdiL (CAAX protease family)
LRVQRITVKRPYLFSIVIVVTISVVNLASVSLATALPRLSPIWLGILAELVLAVLAIVLLTALRAWRNAGFQALSSLKDLRFYWVPVLPLLPVLVAVVTGTFRMRVDEVAFFLVLACLVGFAEEAYFRGLMLRALVSAGPWRAAVISSALFGVLHLQNLLFGADLTGTLLQVGYATAMGFGFAAVTLRTGVIWPLVVIHALIDFAGFVTSGETVAGHVSTTDAAVYGLYILVFVAYGLFMMRSARRLQLQTTMRIADGCR